MLEIVDHLLAPEITEDEVGHLTVLIQQHHINYSQLYSSSMVMPKHHFMTHMPRLILMVLLVHSLIMFVYICELDTDRWLGTGLCATRQNIIT